jgi:hypothetical protein
MVIETARLVDASIDVGEIRQVLAKQFTEPASETTIKRVLVEAGLERSVGRPRKEEKSGAVKVEQLGAAGLELVRAAEAETSAVEDLVEGVMEVAAKLPEAGPVDETEQKLRDKHGQFTARYNRARRKKGGEEVGQAYRTVAEKAETKDLGRLSLKHQKRETIESKVWGLLSMPVLTLGNRIDELYGPRGKFLEGICGYAYMPETLRKTISEWTVAGVGTVFHQVHGASWHRVSVERWERGYQAAVLYVDKTAKPLWTSKFTKAAKVASTGRVQPALVSTYVHTGAGVPIYFETYSGSAPLSPRVLDLLEEVEQRAEYPVGRLTVIDGECCSASLLKAFKERQRDLVTPLSSTLSKPERIRFDRGSAPQVYREGDTIREGTTVLTDSKNKSIQVEARAIVIEQRTKEEWTVLATLADRDEWSARKLADIYYSRWPKQEGFFRLGNGAVSLNKVQGYGKRVVTNTSVVTKLDELEQKLERKQAKLETHREELAEIEASVQELAKEQGRVERYVAKRQERVDAALAAEKTGTSSFAQAVSELRESSDELAQMEARGAKLEDAHQKVSQQIDKTEEQTKKWKRQRTKLEGRREILEADVAQDVLFTSLKLTLAMLVHFVVVEYFPHRPMEWTTFLSRLALLPGRRETTQTAVTTFIEANDRDVRLMEALENACKRINKRRLLYKGRRLRYVIEWPGADTGTFS